MAEQEPGYYYPWLLVVSYEDGSVGRHEFRDEQMLNTFLGSWVSWDAVKTLMVKSQPMLPGKAYKVDVRHQS